MGCQIRSWRADLQQLPPAGRRDPVILLGGYMGIADRERLPYLQLAADWVAAEVRGGRPLLAICLGAQLLAHALKSCVHSQFRQEKGVREITLTATGQVDPLFAGLPNPFVSFEWHNDSFELPEGVSRLAQTDVCPEQAFRFHNAWGVQFHPEVDERIVKDWCQRTGIGEGPLEGFRQQQSLYFAHAKQLLQNFVSSAAAWQTTS
jgi:GMP synthase-like glutamine amidotransferase